MRNFLNKIELEMFNQKFEDSQYFLLIRRCQCFSDKMKQYFHHIILVCHNTTLHEHVILYI